MKSSFVITLVSLSLAVGCISNPALHPTDTPAPTVTSTPGITHTPYPAASLDAFLFDTADQGAASSVVLKSKHKYRIIMAGTYSLWVPQQWTDQGVCIRGNSELQPMFPSIGKMNGRVGADPYYRFARPFYGPCQMTREPGETISAMMFSLDGGSNYSIPTPVIAEYRSDHTYTYEVIGRGFPLKVRLDDAVLDDNYGQILLMIEEID